MWGESAERCSDVFGDGIEGARCGASEGGLELGEDLLDGIEIGRVLGQQEEFGPSLADGSADGLAFMATEVVEDDDVAWPQDRDKALRDVSQEAFAIDGAIDDARCGQAVKAQRSHERQGFPVPVRNLGAQAFALAAAPVCARHIRLDPCLVDEDQAFGIDRCLIFLPALAPPLDVRPVLLTGVHGFF